QNPSKRERYHCHAEESPALRSRLREAFQAGRADRPHAPTDISDKKSKRVWSRWSTDFSGEQDRCAVRRRYLLPILTTQCTSGLCPQKRRRRWPPYRSRLLLFP